MNDGTRGHIVGTFNNKETNMELEYPAHFNVRGILCFIPPEGDHVIYPNKHLPSAKANPRKVDPKILAEVLRKFGNEYPSGAWVVKFPECNVDIEGEPLPTGHTTHNVAEYGSGMLESDFLRKDDVSTDEDGVTVYEGHDRWGVRQVNIKFSSNSGVSKCTDKVAEILAPWL